MTHKLDKKQCQYFHFKKRFLQRFGVVGGEKIQKQILTNVFNRRCSLYFKQSNRVSILDTNIDIDGESTWIRFVYDSKQKQVVTVFPNDEKGVQVEAKFLQSNNKEEEIGNDADV